MGSHREAYYYLLIPGNKLKYMPFSQCQLGCSPSDSTKVDDCFTGVMIACSCLLPCIIASHDYTCLAHMSAVSVCQRRGGLIVLPTLWSPGSQFDDLRDPGDLVTGRVTGAEHHIRDRN